MSLSRTTYILGRKGRPPWRAGKDRAWGANKRGRRVRSALKESEAVNVKIRADLHRKNLIEARVSRRACPSEKRRATLAELSVRRDEACIIQRISVQGRRETYLHYRHLRKRRFLAPSAKE